MNLLRTKRHIGILLICTLLTACKIAEPVQNMRVLEQPTTFSGETDSVNTAEINWKEYFTDKNLAALIDTALTNNFDLLAALQDIEIARNDVRFKKGLLYPTVTAGAGYSLDKVGRYTSQGAGDASADITPGKLVPENLSDFNLGLHASWEADVWGKLRNAKKAAFSRYLSSVEGKNFVVTNLVAEVANTYYEILSLDSELKYIREAIALQQNALKVVQIQKEAGAVNELAVQQFQAEVFNSQSMEFDIQQQIKEAENKINLLLGRYPQPVPRDTATEFADLVPMIVKAGIPSQLLKNRPDIKRAELELLAAKCDVGAAKAEFYPSFNITGGLGFNAFKTSYLFTTPQSLIYSVAGDLVAPLINRSAIKAEFYKASAYQLEALYDYQKTVLNGYVAVSNELSNIFNLQKTYDKKSKAVDALNNAIGISNNLFKSGRANYFEVLSTQREALQSKLELIETKRHQFNAVTNIYKELGGGWK
jgi:NodT family efflux transporter outer membrane factor (OMF) lipoprotein